MKVVATEKLPIKMWLEDIEDGALDQAKNLANLPFAFKHVALMPDSHQGFGMPIGGVLATENVIIPNAVGVDIGCGMCAVRTMLKAKEFETDTLKKIMGEIRKAIPVGFSHHRVAQDESLMPEMTDVMMRTDSDLEIVSHEFDEAKKQIGTLGGGNHFIEIQKGEDGHVWIMIHSGSRNIGLKVAKHYDKIAQDMNKKWHTAVPREWDLAFLPVDSKEGKQYIGEMQYCIEFALANRKLMMERVKQIFLDNTILKLIKTIPFTEAINIAHNYASLESHYGKNVWVHRKGATLARKGTVGIIPGSQGTNSYIVEGKGCKESFESCSHGAGRCMGRKDATRRLNLEEEQKKMEGIVHGIRAIKNLDEAPGAYKDISEVMANQTELVDIAMELKPLGVIKGD